MNDLPDAPEQEIIRSWNVNEPAAPGAIAPASVIFVCKTRGAGQTARMEPHR
jgi:hypothetical protein